MNALTTWWRTHPEAKILLAGLPLVAILAVAVAVGLTGHISPAAAGRRTAGAKVAPTDHATATPSAAPSLEAADQTAREFTVAYLSWRWDESLSEMEDSVRPSATDDLYQRLITQPGSQWTNPGGRALHEVDTVDVQSTAPVGSAGRTVEVELTVVVTERTDAGTTEHPLHVLIRLVQAAGSWKVDEVDL